jgi:hypothetical protein
LYEEEVKKYLILFMYCSALGFCLDDGNATTEESQIALLVEATKKSLSSLQNLQTCFTTFRAREAACLKNPDDAEKLFSLSSSALALLKNIKENQVEPYFREGFLKELEKISKPAESKTIPPIHTP